MTDVNTIIHGQTRSPVGDSSPFNEPVTPNSQGQITANSQSPQTENIGDQLAAEVQGFYKQEDDVNQLENEIQESYKKEDEATQKKGHAYWYNQVLDAIKKDVSQQQKYLDPQFEQTIKNKRLFTENCDFYAKKYKLPSWLLNSCKRFIGVTHDEHGSRVLTMMNEVAEAAHETITHFGGKTIGNLAYGGLWSSTLLYSGKRWLVEGLGKNSASASLSKFTHDLIAGIAAPTIIVRAACKATNWFFKTIGFSGSTVHHLVRPVLAFITGKKSVKFLDKLVAKHFIKGLVDPLLNKHRTKIDSFFGDKVFAVSKFLGLVSTPEEESTQESELPQLHNQETIRRNQELDQLFDSEELPSQEPRAWGAAQAAA